MNLKEKSIATAYATGLSFQNIHNGIIQTNGTNDEVIRRYAQEEKNKNQTNLTVINNSKQIIDLNDTLKMVANMGICLSEITESKLSDDLSDGGIDATKEYKEVLIKFILFSKFIKEENKNDIVELIKKG